MGSVNYWYVKAFLICSAMILKRFRYGDFSFHMLSLVCYVELCQNVKRKFLEKISLFLVQSLVTWKTIFQNILNSIWGSDAY